jgi:hypothetical protein
MLWPTRPHVSRRCDIVAYTPRGQSYSATGQLILDPKAWSTRDQSSACFAPAGGLLLLGEPSVRALRRQVWWQALSWGFPSGVALGLVRAWPAADLSPAALPLRPDPAAGGVRGGATGMLILHLLELGVGGGTLRHAGAGDSRCVAVTLPSTPVSTPSMRMISELDRRFFSRCVASPLSAGGGCRTLARACGGCRPDASRAPR